MTNEARQETSDRSGIGSLGSILFGLVALWAVGLASFPLNDNSFFTHLATGRMILDESRVPSVDPYTFTAGGEAWTVQSWLASVAYASAERLAGDAGLRVLMIVVFLAAATLLWALTQPVRSVIPRLLLVATALAAVTDLWSERPYMVGVIGLGLTWLALEDRIPPWVLVPYLYVWVNSHGSFPLTIVLATAYLIGAVLDRRAAGDDAAPARAARVVGWSAVGILAGAVSPLGVRALLFPMKALTESSSLSGIVEWNSPTFDSLSQRAFLFLLLATFAGLSRVRRWALTVPVVVFGGTALLAQRNMVMAVMVLVPALAAALPELGSLRTDTKPRFGKVIFGLVVTLGAVFAASAITAPTTGFGGYPVQALAWSHGTAGSLPGGQRLATEDFTGNLLEVLEGPVGVVFIDDRADMFPEAVFDDYLRLVSGAPDWEEILDQYEIDRVIWGRQRPLSALLDESAAWRVEFSDTDWVVACRRVAC